MKQNYKNYERRISEKLILKHQGLEQENLENIYNLMQMTDEYFVFKFLPCNILISKKFFFL